MSDDQAKRAEEQILEIYGQVEDQFYRLFSPENQEKVASTLDLIARKSKEGLTFALDLIGELSTELTGVKSFRVLPKPPAELSVEIGFKRENSIKFKQSIAPLVELEAVHFGKKIAFGALVESRETGETGLRVNITEGFSLELNLGPLLGRHQVKVKGSGLLKRDDNKQVVLVTGVDVPGFERPVEVVIPLRSIFHKLGKVI
ncbi:MAG TPA: hypothetical protein PKD05_01815 [Candidatus Melainabacteria bacterium]|nr:hypothetical protein [Candidatus Melainabacteria bacterium]